MAAHAAISGQLKVGQVP